MTIREVSSSISTITSLSLVLFIIGLISLFPMLINNEINDQKENYEILITSFDHPNFLDLNTEKEKLEKYLKNSDFFKDLKFYHKDTAAKNLEKNGESIYNTFKENPLPHAFKAKINSSFISSKGLKEVEEYIVNYSKDSNNSNLEAHYQKMELEQINSFIKEIRLFLFPFGIIFLIISFALINNTIKMSMSAKKMLIRTKKLVGATNSFIQKPYLINSIYQGIIGGIMSILMLIWIFEFTIKNQFQDTLHSNDFINIGIIFASLIILGIMISLISTFFAIRRCLNLTESELYN